MSDSNVSAFYQGLIGTTLNANYRIEEIIGSGGMGAVFLATHLALGSSVAIKVLSPELSSDLSLIKRFEREARVGGKLAHPNIVRVQDFGKTSDGILFMVMEYVKGETLASLLAKYGSLPLDRCVRILEPLCDALSMAHNHNLLHRDLKPANILVGEVNGKEIVKLLDFGIVKLLAPDDHISQLTGIGQVFGTPLYMSPEQLMGLTLTPRADLFSLGVIFFEMLTGKLPADHPELRELLGQKMQGPPAVSSIVGALPKGLDGVMGKILTKNLDDRYASADDFVAAVKAVVGVQPSILTHSGENSLTDISDKDTVPNEPVQPEPEQPISIWKSVTRLFGRQR
jgi:eukaryotic-like serine/threonine-protein kinase